MLKKDISVVKHALLDGMSSKAVWDSFDRIKKFIDESQNTSTNTDSPKLPTLEEVYKAIPFPEEDARECAMFVAGLAECHKFICRQLRAGA